MSETRWLRHGVHVSTFGEPRRLLDTAVRAEDLGCDLPTEPECFFMERDRPSQRGKRRHAPEHLEPGETGRAGAWAAQVAREPVTVASS